MNWSKAEFMVSARKESMDVTMVHGFLTTSYWAKGIDKSTIERAIANSLCLGVFHNEKQIGFGRAITDRSTFAYLADVFILEEYRGRGLGKWCVFRGKPATDSVRRRPPIPVEAGHPFRCKAAADSGGKPATFSWSTGISGRNETECDLRQA